MSAIERQCFVMMPYGKKDIGGGQIIDFEEVFTEIICKSREEIAPHRLNVQRSKDEHFTGAISESFIKSIFHSEVAIIDVSGQNPNVYYELGMRHAMRAGVNFLIGIKGTKLPFDVAGIKLVTYDLTSNETREASVKMLAAHLRAGLERGHRDSPVFKVLDKLRVALPDKPCTSTETFEYVVEGSNDTRIGIKTGALFNIKGLDVWVNSENTEMEMARPYERSFSSIIRYHGARWDPAGRISEDLIQEYLWAELKGVKSVAPSVVLTTDPGELTSFGVKKLLHVASAYGEPGFGYLPIRNVERCVTTCLAKLHQLNGQERKYQSVLMPLFGTGQGGQELADIWDSLLNAAVEFVKNHPQATANRIYFLAYTEEHRDYCRHVMSRFPGLKPVAAAPGPAKMKLNVRAAILELERLKAESFRLRSEGDMNGAIAQLRLSTTVGSEALVPDGGMPPAVEDVSVLKANLADCFGILGGNYLRQGKLPEAIAAFSEGRNLELDPLENGSLTYNTVNLAVARVLASGWDSLAISQADLVTVVVRLKTAVAVDKGNDVWNWADLGTAEFLKGDFDGAISAYTVFARSGRVEERHSALARLNLIQEKRAPATDGQREFFSRINALLSSAEKS